MSISSTEFNKNFYVSIFWPYLSTSVSQNLGVGGGKKKEDFIKTSSNNFNVEFPCSLRAKKLYHYRLME